MKIYMHLSGLFDQKKLPAENNILSRQLLSHQKQRNYFPVIYIDQPQIRQLQGWTDR
ncbi:hypothetical protein PMI05_03722 [Brevibacillus sp. BC25]|nr:hypothetical protein PMI05_03722 [Brevibacillus sp. BC25]